MISSIFIILAAICKAVMDKIQFHFSKSIFKDNKDIWWNPQISWKNKWKNGDPNQGESFFGSSTFLVFVTDAWHFFQFLFLSFIFLGVVFYSTMISWYLDFFIYHIAFGIVFELFFSKIFKKE